jgi:lipid A 3-O-deacylase
VRRMRRAGALLWILLPFAAFYLAGSPARAAEPVEVHASAGRFNVLNRDPLPEAGWEVSFGPRRFHWLPRWLPDLAPAVGAMATSDGALYAYAGFRIGVPLGERRAWRFSPQWAAGLYYPPPGGRSLGGPVEFRSGIELSRQMGNGARIGLLFYHLSNAGFYERNPGSESLVLTYTARP